MSKSKVKRTRSAGSARQYAALPVRFDASGQLEVMLLTSRGTGRWVIPKGWPMRNLAPRAAAAQEAFEEAGLQGTIRPGVPVGSYRYAKGVAPRQLPVTVDVFLLRVQQQLASWPECTQRQTRWFSPEDAAVLVAEPELADILLNARKLVASA